MFQLLGMFVFVAFIYFGFSKAQNYLDNTLSSDKTVSVIKEKANNILNEDKKNQDNSESIISENENIENNSSEDLSSEQDNGTTSSKAWELMKNEFKNN